MVRERSKERACDRAIKKTLAYRIPFKYPLSFYQLAACLVTNKKFDANFLRKQLRRLVKNGTVKIKGGRYYLPVYKPVSWKARMKASEELLGGNRWVIELLSKIPWVKMIGVTGSVASCNASKKEDLDLLIITAKDRVWITRGFVVILLKLIGKYPKVGGASDTICPNIYVDERNLTWTKKKQNIYTAHEVLLLQPAFDKDETYFRFIKANEWVLKLFKNFKINTPEKFEKSAKGSAVIDLVENAGRRAQVKFMAKRKTTEITNKGFIHFNVNDSAPVILEKYEKALKKLGL